MAVTKNLKLQRKKMLASCCCSNFASITKFAQDVFNAKVNVLGQILLERPKLLFLLIIQNTLEWVCKREKLREKYKMKQKSKLNKNETRQCSKST